MKREFKVMWLSSRGFANEGTYIYGDTKSIAKITNSLLTNYEREYICLRNFATLERAKKYAKNQSHEDIKSYSEQQSISCIAVCSAEKFYEEETNPERY